MTSIQQPLIPAAIDRAMRKFWASLDSKEKADFGHVHTEAELMALIDTLEAEQASQGCIRNMTRIMPFVNGLSQYARVIEVFVQVKPDILSLIWNIIGVLYEDILEFYRRTLKFFHRRAWHMFFSLVWRDFESRFGYILDNIRRSQVLIDNEVNAQDIEESHKARELAKEHLEEYIRQKKTKRKKACAEWLSPADVDTAKDNASRTKTPGTSEWLIKSREVSRWLDHNNNNGVDTIWLCGIPGTGIYLSRVRL
ncbi:hypothetical protein K440DRAFT_644273 [Wilcoxina mikolae CBS 423.85]|nr:hypothetical protein K440DRAFT_644273 [Wilcoxina mikolae CBS 423.85]